MTTAMLEKQLKPLEAPLEGDFSKWLYSHLPPAPISDKKEHARYARAVGIVMKALLEDAFHGAVKSEVEDYLRAVGSFIDEYERVRYPAAAVTPESMLRFLMEQHKLSQYDLAKELGGQPVVSDVLNGKRKLTREHIERLGARFNLPPGAFYRAP